MLNESILKNVVEKINHAIIISDTQGNFLLWNDSAKDILGMRPAIVKQEVWDSYFGIFKLDGTKYETHELPIMKATKGIETKKERLYLTDGITGEGRYLDVDAFPVIDTNGNIVAAAASFNDVTKTMKIENAIEELENRFSHIIVLLQNSFFT